MIKSKIEGFSSLSKIVVDTSIIINGQIIREVESGSIDNVELVIPMAVLDELQSQAAQKKEQGFVGLEEIKKLQDLSSKHGISIKFEGNDLAWMMYVLQTEEELMQ